MQYEKNIFPKEGQFNAVFFEKSLMQTVIHGKDYDQEVEDPDETPNYGFDITIRGQEK